MKANRKTIKTAIIAGIVAVFVVIFGTPATSFNAPHDKQQISNQILKGIANRDRYNTINSLNKVDSTRVPDRNLIASRNIIGNQAKVRKNVVDLTPEEKSAFVEAVRTLKTTIADGSNISIYDQFVAVHVGAMGLMFDSAQGPAAGHDGAHESALILPWHRELVYRFEKALQSVNPDVTIPYWDWTDPQALDVIFSDDFMGPNGQGVTQNIPLNNNQSAGPTTASGSEGTSTNMSDFSGMTGSDAQGPPANIADLSGADGQGPPSDIPTISVQGGPVVSGPFTVDNGWVAIPDLHFKSTTQETFGNAILRFLEVPPTNNYPIPKEDIEQVLAINDYNTFRPALEGFIKVDSTGQQTQGVFLHNYFHSFIGGATFDFTVGRPSALGTMADLSSSINDPVFWLVHSNVDRLWAEWQKRGHEGSNYYPASGGHYGENLNDRLWPWDGGESTPANWGPGNLLSYIPSFSPDDIVTPATTLNFRKYGYTYDTLKGFKRKSGEEQS
ncbi:MAG: tyrosinase family protein [Rhizonema sp. PD38]|nr:tyrosinase family protein [Rhizonema sp. PD38]